LPLPLDLLPQMLAASTAELQGASADTITRLLLLHCLADQEPGEAWMLEALPALEAGLPQASPATLALALPLLQELDWVPSWTGSYCNAVVARAPELSTRQLGRAVLPALLQHIGKMEAMELQMPVGDQMAAKQLFGAVYAELLDRADSCTAGDLSLALEAAEDGMVALGEQEMQQLRAAAARAPHDPLDALEDEAGLFVGPVGADEVARSVPQLLAAVSPQWLLESTAALGSC
jgi:hypothetical protein